MERLQFLQPGASEQRFDYRQLMQMRVDCFNSTVGEAQGYDCPLCKNRGGSMYLNPEGYIVYRPCTCQEVRSSMVKAKQSGMEQLLREKTFGNFRKTHPWQEQLAQKCKDYLQHPDRWLVVCGQSGSGKTHLCTAVCRNLLSDGQQVRYMIWLDAAARLKDMSVDGEKRSREKEDYKNAPVLYIDDLLKVGGNAPPSRVEVTLALEIINYRYVQGLRTIISTERSPEELMALDAAMGGRIHEKAGPFLLDVTADNEKNTRMKTS